MTVDRVGRIVIPKAVRAALGIGPDTELELVTDGAGLRLDPVRSELRVVKQSDGLPLLAAVEGTALSDADVQRLRDDIAR